MTSTHKNSSIREYSFKYLYTLINYDQDQLEELKNSPENISASLDEFDPTYFKEDEEHPTTFLDQSAKEKSTNLITYIIQNRESLENELIPLLTKGFSKLHKLDRAILLTALAEQKSDPNLPKKVWINEYVEIAKRFGTEGSSTLINAVLDKII